MKYEQIEHVFRRRTRPQFHCNRHVKENISLPTWNRCNFLS